MSSAIAQAPFVHLDFIAAEDRYEGDGWTMARESGVSENGNPFRLQWVLRNPGGTAVDRDQYRHDLAERRGLKLGNELGS